MKKHQTHTFTPPHCPNPSCDRHTPHENGKPWYIRRGAKIHSAEDNQLIEQFFWRGYTLLRDLILLLKPLFRIRKKYPGCFFGGNRNPSKNGWIAEECRRRVILPLFRMIGV